MKNLFFVVTLLCFALSVSISEVKASNKSCLEAIQSFSSFTKPNKQDINLKVNEFRRYQTTTSSEISFSSSVFQNKSIYRINIKLSRESASIFLSNDKQFVIKKYDPGNPMAIHEILATRYLRELGLNVPEVIDYSTNLFRSDDSPIYVVKEYVVGLDYSERIAVSNNSNDFSQLLDLTRANNVKIAEYIRNNKAENNNWDLSEKYVELEGLKIIYLDAFKNFQSWLSDQGEDGRIYLQRVGNMGLLGDLKDENWILTEDGWLLIDP